MMIIMTLVFGVCLEPPADLVELGVGGSVFEGFLVGGCRLSKRAPGLVNLSHLTGAGGDTHQTTKPSILFPIVPAHAHPFPFTKIVSLSVTRTIRIILLLFLIIRIHPRIHHLLPLSLILRPPTRFLLLPRFVFLALSDVSRSLLWAGGGSGGGGRARFRLRWMRRGGIRVSGTRMVLGDVSAGGAKLVKDIATISLTMGREFGLARNKGTHLYQPIYTTLPATVKRTSSPLADPHLLQSPWRQDRADQTAKYDGECIRITIPRHHLARTHLHLQQSRILILHRELLHTNGIRITPNSEEEVSRSIYDKSNRMSWRRRLGDSGAHLCC